jgi:hypothetical protein
MRTVVVALIAVCLATAAGAWETLDWREAAQCAGRTCTVEGTVVLQQDEEGVTRLYFDPERRDVSVLLVRSLFATWPDYTGRAIRATGKARRFRDQIEVVVSLQRDVEFAVGATPAAMSAVPEVAATSAPSRVPEDAPAATPPPGDGEVERLRRQVQQLEDRVRELEGGR